MKYNVFESGVLPSGKMADCRQGDILYLDGRPCRSPFYAVYYKVTGKRKLLYIYNVERLQIAEKYGLSDFEGHYEGVGLTCQYLSDFLLFDDKYKIKVVNSCPYKCLTKASVFLKENPCWEGDIEKKIYPIFKDEFKNRLFHIKEGESRMKEILAELTKVAKNYPEVSFMDYMEYLAGKTYKDTYMDLLYLTDTEFSKLLLTYEEITMLANGQIRKKRYQELEEEYLQLGEPLE